MRAAVCVRAAVDGTPRVASPTAGHASCYCPAHDNTGGNDSSNHRRRRGRLCRPRQRGRVGAARPRDRARRGGPGAPCRSAQRARPVQRARAAGGIRGRARVGRHHRPRSDLARDLGDHPHLRRHADRRSRPRRCQRRRVGPVRDRCPRAAAHHSRPQHDARRDLSAPPARRPRDRRIALLRGPRVPRPGHGAARLRLPTSGRHRIDRVGRSSRAGRAGRGVRLPRLTGPPGDPRGSRAHQERRQRVPRPEDLVRQRAGRPGGAGRRGHRPSPRNDRARPADRLDLHARQPRVRRKLPAQGAPDDRACRDSSAGCRCT